MQAIRTLLGAVVGAALGAGFIALLGAFAPKDGMWGGMWPMVVVGLLAGLSMRMIASTHRVSYLRGALAALVAVLSLLGGKHAEERIINAQEPKSIDISSIADTEVAEGEEGDTTASGEVTLPTLPQLDLDRSAGRLGAAPKEYPLNDALWLAAGALIAYQIGKGCGGKAPEEDAEAGDGTASGDGASGNDGAANGNDAGQDGHSA